MRSWLSKLSEVFAMAIKLRFTFFSIIFILFHTLVLLLRLLRFLLFLFLKLGLRFFFGKPSEECLPLLCAQLKELSELLLLNVDES